MEVDQKVKLSKIKNKYKAFGPPDNSWSNIDAGNALYSPSGTIVP